MRVFIPTFKFKNEQILAGVERYFSLKNYHLEEALKIRVMSPGDSNFVLGMHYCNYFVSLLSALEMLQDGEYPHAAAFKVLFDSRFVFPGYPDAQANYSYLRELRNAILHRGYDPLNFGLEDPLNPGFAQFVLPETTTNMKVKSEHPRFAVTMIELIHKIESVIGGIILDHATQVNLYQVELSDADRKK